MPSISRYPLPVTLEQTNIIAEQMKRYVCQVFSHNGGQGTGFFCTLSLNNFSIPTLITCCHIIDVNKLLPNGSFEIRTKETFNKIQINDDRALYSNEEYDITIIEIKPDKDKIYHFLDIDEGIFYDFKNSYYSGNNNNIYLIYI